MFTTFIWTSDCWKKICMIEFALINKWWQRITLILCTWVNECASTYVCTHAHTCIYTKPLMWFFIATIKSLIRWFEHNNFSLLLQLKVYWRYLVYKICSLCYNTWIKCHSTNLFTYNGLFGTGTVSFRAFLYQSVAKEAKDATSYFWML
jgi:hypothetical protein